MATAMTPSFWLQELLLEGQKTKPKDGGIAIIGSGLSGVSTAYWLLQNGFDDITMIDFESPKAASYRNCGHILYGTVESMHALVSLHGAEKAKEIWQFSIDICHEVRDTIAKLNLDADYQQDGYLVIAIDDAEDYELRQSIELLHRMGFNSSYVSREELTRLNFREVHGGRFEPGSAQAHPVKFRNALLAYCLKNGVKYHSGLEITDVREINGRVHLSSPQSDVFQFDAAVIAANAYSPLLSEFFAKHRLIEPFRGQIITSAPLKHDFKIKYPHSFDHGYEYAIVTADNRLMIGGWRNHTAGETGTYEITPNPFVEMGLQEFAAKHYAIEEKIRWEFSWAGIMAASKTGFPFIGPTDSQLIFTVSGYTGHGFSWAHGSAKLLASIMAGAPVPAVAKYFNPRLF